MDQSPSSEANSHPARQGIPHIYGNGTFITASIIDRVSQSHISQAIEPPFFGYL